MTHVPMDYIQLRSFFSNYCLLFNKLCQSRHNHYIECIIFQNIFLKSYSALYFSRERVVIRSINQATKKNLALFCMHAVDHSIKALFFIIT
jgi:hypothetical protein